MDLSTHGFWFPWRVLKPIPHGYRGMTVLPSTIFYYNVTNYHKSSGLKLYTCVCFCGSGVQAQIDWVLW